MTLLLAGKLGAIPRQGFLEGHYLKAPFAGAHDLVHELPWELALELAVDESADRFFVLNGGRSAQKSTCRREAERFYSEGWTLVVRHAERHCPELRTAADLFQAEFRGPVDVHLFFSPEAGSAFGWHYDAEEVFLLQVAGGKRCQLRKNTVNPWPLAEAIPADMHYEREIMPLMRCTLERGDWLYIPGGYWHSVAATSRSITAAFGVMAPTAMDVLDHVRLRLCESLRWRQRLPLAAEDPTESLDETYRRLFQELGRDLARLLQDDRLRESFVPTGPNDPMQE